MTWTARVEGSRDQTWPEMVGGDNAKKEATEQYDVVKNIVPELLRVVGLDGENILVSIVGHANIDHAHSNEWADEFITISVSTRGKK